MGDTLTMVSHGVEISIAGGGPDEKHDGSRSANGRIYREKSVGVGSDGAIKIVFLDLLSTHVLASYNGLSKVLFHFPKPHQKVPKHE